MTADELTYLVVLGLFHSIPYIHVIAVVSLNGQLTYTYASF